MPKRRGRRPRALMKLMEEHMRKEKTSGDLDVSADSLGDKGRESADSFVDDTQASEADTPQKQPVASSLPEALRMPDMSSSSPAAPITSPEVVPTTGKHTDAAAVTKPSKRKREAAPAASAEKDQSEKPAEKHGEDAEDAAKTAEEQKRQERAAKIIKRNAELAARRKAERRARAERAKKMNENDGPPRVLSPVLEVAPQLAETKPAEQQQPALTASIFATDADEPTLKIKFRVKRARKDGKADGTVEVSAVAVADNAIEAPPEKKSVPKKEEIVLVSLAPFVGDSHDVCSTCGLGGNLVCCEACPESFHPLCWFVWCFHVLTQAFSVLQ